MGSQSDRSTKDQILLVVDSGLFTHVAEALAPHFKRTDYWSEWARSAFPQEKHARIGDGLEGIERIQDVYGALLDGVDLVVFPDVVTAQFASYCKALGIPTFGTSKHAAELELNRWETRKVIKKLGLPVTDAVRIVGMDDLEKHLKENSDVFVKYGRYRGDVETFHHEDWFRTEQWFADTARHLGPGGAEAEFVVESPVDGVEAGVDSYHVGSWPERVLWGYEQKDAGYVGRVVEFARLPDPLRVTCERITPVLTEREHRGFISTECRITEEGVPYLIDPCLRCGSPPSEVQTALTSNLAGVVSEGARGRLVQPAFVGRFAAEVILRSAFSEEHFLALDIPEKVKDRIKLHNHCRIDGKDYVVPIGIREIGAAVGTGETLDEAKARALEAADSVRGYEVEYDKAAFDELDATIEQGKKCGLDWPSK